MIPDMLKNAPMFKRLESRIKVPAPYMLLCFSFQFHYLFSDLFGLALSRVRAHQLELAGVVLLQCVLE